MDRLKLYLAPHTKRLLVIEDNDRERASIAEYRELVGQRRSLRQKLVALAAIILGCNALVERRYAEAFR